MSISSCTITGHKSTRFKFKYQEDYSLCKKIKRSLASLIEKAYQDGSRTFFVGGALGVDMWAGEIISEMKATPEYADIHLICTLPFAGYDAQWDEKSKKRMKRIIAACDGAVKVCEVECPDAYKIGSYYMVDHSDYLIAVYDWEGGRRSSTGQTVNYAKKRGLGITFIHPDTAEITTE